MGLQPTALAGRNDYMATSKSSQYLTRSSGFIYTCVGAREEKMSSPLAPLEHKSG